MAVKKQLTTEEFNALSKAEQKVLICQDVIAQIEAKKYKGNTGSYITNIQLSRNKPIWRSLEDDIQENFGKIKSCHVCGIGACIMSLTKFKNRLKFGDVNSSAEGMSKATHRLLKSVFTIKEMLWIESIFEGGNTNYVDTVYDTDSLSGEELELCQEIFWKIPNPNKRLIAIMQNFINNNGRLVPSQLLK